MADSTKTPLRVLFLISPITDGTPHNDNHVVLPEAFAAADWEVVTAHHDHVCLRDGQLICGDRPLLDYQLIWPVGFGPRATFLDRIQLLAQLPQTRLITPVHALATLHGKAPWLHHGPLHMASSNLDDLSAFAHSHGGAWVLKPNAGSLGQGVYICADAAAVGQQCDALKTQKAVRLWILQRYLPQIDKGELRTLMFHDQILGTYRRLPAESGLTNLNAGGTATKGELSSKAGMKVQEVMSQLKDAGVGFAAIDTVGDYLMEVNLANPGGLSTLTGLYQRDVGMTVAVSARRCYPGQRSGS